MQGAQARVTPLVFSGRMKIAFIGTHGVGKTTLCYDLAAALKKRDLTVELVREVARECPLPINRETTLKAQAWILHTQIAWELQAEAKADVVFCDRAVLDNFCYMRRAFTGAPAEAVLQELVRSWTKTYDVLFKVPIVGNPRFDGVRDTDLEFQREIDGSIEQTLAVWGVPHVPLDPARRGDWGALVLDALLPRLRPQELLFPEPGERLTTTGAPNA
jgi:predicted ATPase